MYVRIKKISGRRYVYLVEGARQGNKITQKTLAYLGPVPSVALGIPDLARKEIQRKIGRKIDWNAISNRIREIPLTFDELNISRQRTLSESVRLRNLRVKRRLDNPRPFPRKIFQERADGELEALAKLSALGFEKTFEKIGDRKYRMRL